jgi:manganese-dependent inorganic pyrophosphatase
VRFAVSQVEELGFGNFWQHAKPIAAALADLRDRGAPRVRLPARHRHQHPEFAAAREGRPGVHPRISYAHVEQDEIFDLPGIVSRKKQLIPYLTSLLKEMAADGNAD